MDIIPLSKPSVGKEEQNAISKVLKSGWLIQGPKVEEFEKKFAELRGVKYAVACNSCTSALEMCMESMGIGYGDEVIVPPFSFIASANCIRSVKAKPIFVDIEKNTYNMDASKIEEKISDKTKAIIAVHQFGLMCDMDEIMRIANKHNLKVIEDAACAHTAEYNGKKSGSIGDAGCFSFHPRKVITTGEGGMITTNNEQLYRHLQALRNHGMDVGQGVWERYKTGQISMPSFKYYGHNFRMTDFQAAMGIEQLKKLDLFLNERRMIAAHYNSNLDKNKFELPLVPNGRKHCWQTYMLLVKGDASLDELIVKAKKEGVTVQKYMAIPSQPVYSNEYNLDNLPLCKYAESRGIALPIYPGLTKENQERVINTLNSI